MKNQKNRWLLAASLVLTLGLTPLALAQEEKTGGMMKGEPMMEQKGDAMKDQGAMKSKNAMKDKSAMKEKDAVKDTGAMKDQKDNMGKR